MTVPSSESDAVPFRRCLFGLTLKPFLFSGLIWLALALTACGLWKGVCYTAVRLRQIVQLIEWAQSLTDIDGKTRPIGPLEKWIRLHLPPAPKSEYAAAAAAFGETAGMLRDGTLRGERDAFAELTCRLETAVDRQRWYSFLTELSARLDAELSRDSGAAEPARELADLLDRTAAAIQPKGASPLFEPFREEKRAEDETEEDRGEGESPKPEAAAAPAPKPVSSPELGEKCAKRSTPSVEGVPEKGNSTDPQAKGTPQSSCANGVCPTRFFFNTY